MLKVTLQLQDAFTDELTEYTFHDATSTKTLKEFRALPEGDHRIEQALERAEELHETVFEYIGHSVEAVA